MALRRTSKFVFIFGSIIGLAAQSNALGFLGELRGGYMALPNSTNTFYDSASAGFATSFSSIMGFDGEADVGLGS